MKGLGLEVDGQAQVSMNLVDLERTPLYRAYDTVKMEAAAHGVAPTWSEIVGLVPERALFDTAARHIQLLATWSFLLMGTTMVIFGTVRANGAVVGPLIILAIGLVPIRLGFALGAYSWLKADALWLSFPVSSLANIAMAIAFYLHGGWKKSRMSIAPLDENEAVEEALAEAEPGGRLNPAG